MMNLIALFGIALLDKFCFNGIRALLVVYLVTHFHFTDDHACKSYAAIMGLAFMAPLICGYLADRFQYSIQILIYSSLWIGVAMFTLILPFQWMFYPSMAALIVGSGFIKTMIPSLIALYAKLKNENEESIYAKLYVYFNLGSLLGTICCSVIGEVFGWSYGFLTAGFAMLLASGLSLLIARYSVIEVKKSNFYYAMNKSFAIKINIIILGLIGLVIFLISYQGSFQLLLYIAFLLSVMILFYRSWKGSEENLKNSIYLLYLMIIHTLFFALYEQSSLSLVVFTAKMVDRSPDALFPFLSTLKLFDGSFKIPVTFFQTIDPIINILLGGFFVKLWRWISIKKPDMSFVAKFSLGLICVSIAFFMLGSCCENNLVSPWLMVATYFFIVLGEQCAVPIGFSAVSTLSPKKVLAFTMGVWFTAIAISENLAEYISHTIMASSYESVAAFKNNFLNLFFVVIAITVIFYSLYRLAIVINFIKENKVKSFKNTAIKV